MSSLPVLVANEDDGRASAYIQKKTNRVFNERHFVVNLSARFILLFLFAVATVAFLTGAITPILLSTSLHHSPTSATTEDTINKEEEKSIPTMLPSPLVSNGHHLHVPLTNFTTKLFQQEATIHTVHLDRRGTSTENDDDDNDEDSSDDDDEEEEDTTQEEEEELHLPSGQHLLVDIKNVEPAFLNSEERLATAMVDLILETNAVLLSYHCHRLVPMGVSCVGVLLESHVSLCCGCSLRHHVEVLVIRD